MNHADDFDELAALLPFYANGRLDAEQSARIDAALATMPELRAELAEVRALQARIKTSGERALGPERSSPDERLRALQARIAAETASSASERDAAERTAETPASTSRPTQPMSGAPAAQARFGSRRPRFRPSLSMALAAGLAAICVVQGTMLYRLQSDEDSGEYASLSGPTDRPVAAGARFTLRFRAETPWSDIRALCERLNLRIVGGPQDGMIDVAPVGELNAAQADAIEAALERSPSVAFVGRQG